MRETIIGNIKNRVGVFFIIFSFPLILAAQQRYWDSDAGLIKPYSANVIVSSGENIENITDGNPSTFWQSGNPLPQQWIKRPELNVLLNAENYTVAPQGYYYNAFDGNDNTKADIARGYLEIHFKTPYNIHLFSLKTFCSDTVFIDFYDEKGITKTLYYSPATNYNLLSYKNTGKTKMIVLRSRFQFSVFEIAALTQNPYEWVVFDFGEQKNIGWIASRHYNKYVKSIKVYWSAGGKRWNFLLNLNPSAVAYVNIPLKNNIKAGYLKVVFELQENDYLKAALWEFEVYDRYGPYGKPFSAVPSANTWDETFGINTIWGWGYSVYSDRLSKDKGAGLFNKVAKQLRSYHNIDWDIKNPSEKIDFNLMKKQGTPAKKWLNWDKEYSNWKKHGFSIDVTIMFNDKTFPDTVWNNAYYQAFNYGSAFAKHFVQTEHLVDIIEVGNEPWNYALPVYQSILEGMSAGIKSVSEATVLPCAVQAFNPFDGNNNYISQYITEKQIQHIDGLNTHVYPYVFNENGIRKAINPEDPRSQVWSINNLHRFVGKNMPASGRKIYVTEFGYDSNGGNENCTHSECVSEFEQAIFGVRMALVLWRLGTEKLYWYYFANVDYDSFMHNRSGLTSSYKNGFEKKMSFDAFEMLLKYLGDFKFEKVVSENKDFYAYQYFNTVNGKKIIIAWRPTAEQHKRQKMVVFNELKNAVKAVDIFGNKVNFDGNSGKIFLSGIPVLIFF